MSQIIAMPMAAETIPTTRNAPSGASSTCAIARLVIAGKAANSRPSIANTRPSATRKSSINANYHAAGAGRPPFHFGGAAAPGRDVASGALPDGLTK